MNEELHAATNPSREKISCQVVSYNSEKTIRSCLKSLSRLSSASFEIIIVIIDNASTDQTRKIIEEEQGNFNDLVRVHHEDTNLGFSGGHNKAISISRSEGASYITLINPDLCLHPDAIIHMRNAFDSGYKTGAVCPRLYRSDDEFSEIDPPHAILDTCGMTFESSFRHFDRGSGMPAETPHGKNFPHPEYVPGASGACVMFSVACMDEVTFPAELNEAIPQDRREFLDEDFFAYREDAELSLRIKWLGWRIRYEPKAEGFHVRKVLPERRNSLPPKINSLGVKNRFLIQIQTLPLMGFLLLCPMILIRNIIVIAACLIRERTSLHAFREIVANFPRTLKKRRWLLGRRKSSLLSFISLFYQGNSGAPALVKQTEPIRDSVPSSLHISIVSYDQSEDISHNLPILLESLKGIPEWKITITNNCPEDASFSSLKEQFRNETEISFICPEDNLGFAKANNMAFEESTADMYLLLNPDICLNHDAIHKILQMNQEYANLGAISPVLIDQESGEIQFRYLAKKLPRVINLFQNLFFLDSLFPSNPLSRHESSQDDPLLLELLKEKRSTLYEIEQAAGACLFIPAKIFKSLGGLDPSYFPAWFEDVDLAGKIRNAGLVSAIHTDTRVSHRGGTSEDSIGRCRLLKYFYKNMSVYWKKHNTSSIPFPVIRSLIFLSFFSRRFSFYIGNRISSKSTDSLQQVWNDFRYFFS